MLCRFAKLWKRTNLQDVTVQAAIEGMPDNAEAFVGISSIRAWRASD